MAADKNYDTAEFLKASRQLGITPHVAATNKGSAIDRRTTRHETYRVSQRTRKRVEEVFGWLKTVGGLRRAKFIGRAKLAAPLIYGCAAYDLVRIGSLNGWWNARHS